MYTGTCTLTCTCIHVYMGDYMYNVQHVGVDVPVCMYILLSDDDKTQLL